MYIYLITTFTPEGKIRATIHFTCDEPDIQKAKALICEDETATIIAQ
jgi:hypothetical protein